MKRTSKSVIAFVLAAFVGAVNGFFGGGGGMLLVPLLRLTGSPVRRAHATAVAVILPTSIAGAISCVAGGSMDWVKAALVAVGCVVGGPIGAALLRKVPSGATAFIFALVTAGVGIKLAFFP